MKYLNRYAIIILLLFVFYFGFNFFNLMRFEGSTEPPSEVIESFDALRHKISQLEDQLTNKQSDINSLKEAFASNVVYYNSLVDRQKQVIELMKNNSLGRDLSAMLRTFTTTMGGGGSGTNSSRSSSTVVTMSGQSNLTNSSSSTDLHDLRSLLTTLSLNVNRTEQLAAANEIEFPQAISYLPHLSSGLETHHAQLLVQPKFKLSKNRFASIVIGIPTIKRDKTSYLLETLKSLFDSMNDLEKLEALVIVMIAEIEDHSYVQDTIELISRAFKYEMTSGLLDIVVPPVEFYPELNRLGPDRVFNDSAERVKWRTKQNYDFAYLMTYARKRGQYYLQLEDDVVSKHGFFSTIKAFIRKQTSSEWMMLEFSQLGFIGKLFKCYDLQIFINFFLMFATNKPCDWLYDSVFAVKMCNPEKEAHNCERSKTDLKIRYKPSLFQHVGVQSSLKGKIQKLKDKDFGKEMHIIAHNNPPAKVSSSLKTYMKFSLDGAYLGLNFFWSMAPIANDFILFEFNQPATIYKYYIKTGNPEHPTDRLYNSTLHIKTTRPINDSALPANYLRTTDGFYIIDTISNEYGSFRGVIDPRLTGPISQLRIHIRNAYDSWIIITEIDFSTKPDDTYTLFQGSDMSKVATTASSSSSSSSPSSQRGN